MCCLLSKAMSMDVVNRDLEKKKKKNGRHRGVNLWLGVSWNGNIQFGFYKWHRIDIGRIRADREDDVEREADAVTEVNRNTWALQGDVMHFLLSSRVVKTLDASWRMNGQFACIVCCKRQQ